MIDSVIERGATVARGKETATDFEEAIEATVEMASTTEVPLVAAIIIIETTTIDAKMTEKTLTSEFKILMIFTFSKKYLIFLDFFQTFQS